MPVYEFYCNRCNKLHETYYHWKYNDETVYTDDPQQEECPECNGPVDLLPSMCTMKPDTHWNGVYFENTDVYSTSKSKYDKLCKDKGWVEIGDRTDRESMTKMANQALVEKDKKAEKDLEKSLVEYFKSEEFGIMGTVKERNKKEAELRRLESAHPEDVFDDPAFK